MFLKLFVNLFSNNFVFNDEVFIVVDGRVSSEGCCRFIRVMFVIKVIWF